MKRFIAAAIVLSLLATLGCNDDGDSGTRPKQGITFDTLLTGLEYPAGLWIRPGKVFFTETAGRSTIYGGKVALSVYDIASETKELLIDNPANSDAVVVSSTETIYLTSYIGSLPGDAGEVSYVAYPAYDTETHLLDIKIASQDMYINAGDDIFIIGSCDNPMAESLYKLPAGAYTSPEVIKSGLGRATAVSKRGENIYYSTNSGVFRLVGGVTMEQVSDKECFSMTESPRYLYFADYYSGTVFRLDKETGDDKIIVSGLNSLIAVRWDDASRKLYLLEAGTEANQYKDGTLQVISGL